VRQAIHASVPTDEWALNWVQCQYPDWFIEDRFNAFADSQSFSKSVSKYMDAVFKV